MSVSLVVFRLEIATENPDIQDLCYNAPYYDVDSRQKNQVSYADVARGPCVVQSLTDSNLGKHRGKRQHTAITVETFVAELPTDTRTVDDVTVVKTEMADHEVQEATCVSVGDTDTSTEDDGFTVARSKKSKRVGPPRDDVASSENAKTATVRVKDDGVVRATSSQASSLDFAGAPTLPEDLRDRRFSADRFPEGECVSPHPGSGKGRTKGLSPPSLLPATMRFFSGNPSVETTEGIIHLYKDSQMTSLTEEVPRSEMMCILGVPATMTSPDLLQFIGPVEPWVQHLKVIRDATPNQYMVLIKFRTQDYADDFYKMFNNHPFNSIEPDVCHLVYVARVETVKEMKGGSLPIAGLTELPVCPVCLERMDESVDGILTILCNHSFHGSCLAQWGDTSCPVCRYVQTPEVVLDNKCFSCTSKESLWICLICGHVGCGRYVEGCAYRHFEETNHTYAMQLDNKRVWDYAGDNYVHRIIQSKGDGKLVEFNEGRNTEDEEKLDSITLEYTYLLTSQLEAQRLYFEEKMERIEAEAMKQVETMDVRSKKSLEECSCLEQRLGVATRERQTIEKKCTHMLVKLAKLNDDLGDEKEMNRGLRDNQRMWQEKVALLEADLARKDKEIGELREQLRDLMFFLEAKQTLATTTEATQQEIQEGQIIVQSPTASGHAGKKGRKKTR